MFRRIGRGRSFCLWIERSNNVITFICNFGGVVQLYAIIRGMRALRNVYRSAIGIRLFPLPLNSAWLGVADGEY